MRSSRTGPKIIWHLSQRCIRGTPRDVTSYRVEAEYRPSTQINKGLSTSRNGYRCDAAPHVVRQGDPWTWSRAPDAIHVVPGNHQVVHVTARDKIRLWLGWANRRRLFDGFSLSETSASQMFNPSRAPRVSSRPATLSPLVTVTPASHIQALTPFHHHLWGPDFGWSPLDSSLGYMRAGE